MQALQARRGQKEQQEQQEQERQDNEQQQGESGESLPRMETASPYDRLCPCAAATRPAPGGLSWERLGRLALLVNSSEILTKSLPEASRDLPELILELLGLILGLLGLTLGLLGRSWGSPGAPGSLWGASWGLQKGSQSPSRRLPSQKLDFRSILDAIWAPFFDPPDLEKQGFRVEGVAFFEKSRGSRKSPKNTSRRKPDYHGTGSARGERA